MASGHVNRANRPNTWLHRPMLLREKSSCQLGAVHTWLIADMEKLLINARFWNISGYFCAKAGNRLRSTVSI